jgi:predicted lipase
MTDHHSLGIGDTTGFVAIDRVVKAIIVSFRGSKSLANFITNLESTFEAAPHICRGCELSTGFFNDWKVANMTVINAVNEAMSASENKGYKLVVTGHSLGAAVATICAAVLRGNYSLPLTLVGNDLRSIQGMV